MGGSEGFELLRKCVEIDGAHYPETLGTHYIINAPLIFTGMWKVIKKWLDPKTAAKFEVHGTDYRAALLKAIHPSQLPVEYGGTSSHVLPPLLLALDQLLLHGGFAFDQFVVLLTELDHFFVQLLLLLVEFDSGGALGELAALELVDPQQQRALSGLLRR